MSTLSTASAGSAPGEVQSFDRALLACVLLLACFGLVMVYSVSSVQGTQLHGDGFFFLKRQGVSLAVGLVGLALASRVHPEAWSRLAYPLLGVSLMVLVLVLIPGLGTQVGGARRWFRVLGFSLQPSELTKLAVVLYLARSVSRKAEKMRQFSVGIVPHAVVLLAVAALLLAEPDLGAVVTLGLLSVALLFVGGARLVHLGALALLTLPPVGYLIWASPYRLRRVLTFLDPWAAPQSDGFQIIQSFLAFGSGGITGQGLGDSRQKLFFLPEAHTDFILSVIGEELGLIGVALVISAYAFLVIRGLQVAVRCSEPSAQLLATGLSLLIGIEAFTNAAVVMGLLPTKGLTLPLISFGGSSLVATLFACGMLLSLSSKG